jgi:hypothetical protein
MRWDDTDCGDSGMQLAISKRRCDEIRRNEKKLNIQKAWQELVAAKHQKVCLLSMGTVFAPLYGL